MKYANDNVVPAEWLDLLEANKKWNIFTDLELLQFKHMKPNAIANYAWFVRFEGSFRETERGMNVEEKRSQIRIIK